MLNKPTPVGLLVIFAVAGCGGDAVTVSSVCGKLEAAGIAKSCENADPEGLGATASSRVTFQLAKVEGKGGQVLGFGSVDTCEAAVKSFQGAALLAGPHRYGNCDKKIFVQANTGMSAEEGEAVKKLVAEL